MPWDEETDDYARERLEALSLAIYRAMQVYVNFPGSVQAAAIRDLIDETDEALSGYEDNRKELAGERDN